MASRSTAFLWGNLRSDVQADLGASRKLDDAALNKQPLAIIIHPEETALQAIGNGDVYEALHRAYEKCEVVENVPSPGWSVRILFDRVKSSL